MCQLAGWLLRVLPVQTRRLFQASHRRWIPDAPCAEVSLAPATLQGGSGGSLKPASKPISQPPPPPHQGTATRVLRGEAGKGSGQQEGASNARSCPGRCDNQSKGGERKERSRSINTAGFLQPRTKAEPAGAASLARTSAAPGGRDMGKAGPNPAATFGSEQGLGGARTAQEPLRRLLEGRSCLQGAKASTPPLPESCPMLGKRPETGTGTAKCGLSWLPQAAPTQCQPLPPLLPRAAIKDRRGWL